MNLIGARLNRKLTRVGMAIIFSFLTFFIFFPVDHNATPGRTLVIHNNTNATLFFLNNTRWRRQPLKPGESEVVTQKMLYDAANISVPPLSKKSLFNFLDKNNNVIFVYPKFVRPTRRFRIMAVYVTGKETSPKELYIFPKDFGFTFMCDAPGVSR